MRWIALFAESEKGTFDEGVEIFTPIELLSIFGHPPSETRGMDLAIQALHYNYPLLFFRVKEEGFSIPDYRNGLSWMESRDRKISALFAPGAGSLDILDPLFQFSLKSKALLLTTEQDFFDYLTS